MQQRSSLCLTLGLLLGSSCATFSDPAVRLSACLGRAAESLRDSHDEELTVTCDFRLKGSCVVVLHPEGELPASAYEQAGLGKITSQLQALRLGGREAIYVVPLDGQAKPSRTTAQNRVVSIPSLLVQSCSNSTVTFTLRKSDQGIKVVSLE